MIVGIAVLLLNVGFTGCIDQSDGRPVDIKIINERNSEVIVINITLDGDELENFTIPANSTYTITGLDPKKYPQGESHSLNITYTITGVVPTFNEKTGTFEHLCHITIREGNSKIRLV